MNRHILLVDDDPDLLHLLTIRLEAAGYRITAANGGKHALALLAAETPDVVITDMRMPEIDGSALFATIRKDFPGLPVIMLTAHGTIPEAVEATRSGVFSYLTKPYEPQALLAEVARAAALSVPAPGRGMDVSWREEIVTRNPAMETLLAQAWQIAKSDARVLIYGASGTGKELLARAIHRSSLRRDGPFLAVNCGAIPEQLLESELFGHTKGAFTGAIRDQRGLFQEANGGTLLLDEIGDMPLPLQVKLLRVLEEQQIRPVGSAHSQPVDVRILSATHRSLENEIAAGRFREDLRYRLQVVTLTLPTLAQRHDDIHLLATHFLRNLSQKYDKTINGFAPEALELLATASWPGNIRQLHNVVEQAVVLSTDPLISASQLRSSLAMPADGFTSLEEARNSFERDYLVKLLRLTGGHVARAARMAQRNRTEFYKLLQRHRIDPTLFKEDRN
ncbi:MAG: sigma 54-interacting transcriptional regulator [Proteobacteria bacterium]|nr:sigma 54-interacting transcriptional regulator [Pseudomonadota bacterium]HQR02642.1 sigma 54-interacting transcriptional regulator [Rhodocyclaceae bacterium]